VRVYLDKRLEALGSPAQRRDEFAKRDVALSNLAPAFCPPSGTLLVEVGTAALLEPRLQVVKILKLGVFEWVV
jgi:hypothetical protein